MNIARNFNKFLSVSKVFLRSIKKDASSSGKFSIEQKALTTESNKKALYWTAVNDPAKHTNNHLANFYTIDPEHQKRWFSYGLELDFYRVNNAFKEFNLMIRQPALEVIDFLNKAAEKSTPVLKFVFHGRNGCGKSSSLAHVIHYAGVKEWVIVHVPWAAFFNRQKPGKVQYSSHSKEMRVDLPKISAALLTRFKHQNEGLLQEKDLKLKNHYTWNKREGNKPGDALMDVIDFGINRPMYATDVVGVLLKELKVMADENELKMLVAIDGVNAFWSLTNIKQEDDRTRFHPAGELSLVHFFKKLLKSDWHNGAVVCTVDGNAQYPSNSLKYLPLDLLGQEGFEHIDPFLPVFVQDYDEKEFHASLRFFFDNKWFAKPYSQTIDGIREIKALSCMNPLEIYKIGVWM